MLFELIAVIVAGVAAGGITLVTRRAAPALPRWLVPIAAGGAMLVAAISLEYSWFGRTAAGLPERTEVASKNEARAPWRPWTYIVPYVDRFVVVDRASVRTKAGLEGQRMVDLYLFGRWTPTIRITSVFDCGAGRRADLGPDVSLAEDGSLSGASWIDTGLDDPVTRTACGEA